MSIPGDEVQDLVELKLLAETPWDWASYVATDGRFVLRVMFSDGPYKIDVGRFFLVPDSGRPDDFAACIRREYPHTRYPEISKASVRLVV